MHKIRTYILIAFCWTLYLIEFSQSLKAQSPLDSSLLIAARKIMNTAKTCALITLGENSLSNVRAMDPFAPESDFTVWFGTNSNSRKVSQIKKNPNVILYYLDDDATGYVTIQGVAEIVDDSVEKEKRWKPAWKDFYPDRPDGYSLIKVFPISIEVVSEPRGILGDSFTWKPSSVHMNKN